MENRGCMRSPFGVRAPATVAAAPPPASAGALGSRGRPPERLRPRSKRPGCRASSRPNSSTADRAGVEMVLGDPVAGVAEPFGLLGQVDAVPQRLGGVRAGRDRDKVQDG